MKKLIALVLALMMALGMAACAPAEQDSTNNTTQGSGNETTQDQGGEQTQASEVEIWYYWETVKHQEALNYLIEQYNEAHSDVVVTAKYVPFADFKKQLSIGATADELPDLVIIDSPDHASYATMGIFADLTGRFDTSTYYDGPVASCTIDGKLYGVPADVNCLGLFYNKDMLEEAGLEVPTTWDELKAAAVALTKDNVTGLAFCSLPNEEGTFNFAPWLWSTGATSYDINNENGIRALTFVKDLVDSGAMSKECINWTQGDVMNQFISGNVAMMINGPWQIPTMRAEAPDLNWDVALIPKDSQFASVIGGENFAVIAGGNEEGALAFLEYLTAKEQIEYLMVAMGNIAPDKTIADQQFTDDPVMQKFAEQMEYAQARGPHADWPSISNAISLAFNEVMTGVKTPEDAAATAQATIDSIVG